MARKFLYLVAILIGLVIVAAITYRLFGADLFRVAMTPRVAFVAPTPRTAADYADKALWLARPDLPGNASEWRPQGATRTNSGKAAVFFVHPTSFISPAGWNAAVDDERTNRIATNLVKGQASALATAGTVWAPRYRQASIGTFMIDAPEAAKAHEAAYLDVLAAFDAFIAQAPKEAPIILAGHSQGSFHLVRMLRERVAGTPIATRIAVAYLVGWPVSIEADLPAMGLPACARADSSNCVLSWMSFSEPAEAAPLFKVFDATPGMTGQSRVGKPIVCSNPAIAEASGFTPLDFELGPKSLTRGVVAAKCMGRGLLMVSNPPNLGAGVMPGNNWHVYDYALFWEALRADAPRRLSDFKTP